MWLYSCLTSAVPGGGCSASRPGRFHSGKRATLRNVEEGGWAPRLVWRVMEERQSLPQASSNPQHFILQRVGNNVVLSLKNVYPYLHSAVGFWRCA